MNISQISAYYVNQIEKERYAMALKRQTDDAKRKALEWRLRDTEDQLRQIRLELSGLYKPEPIPYPQEPKSRFISFALLKAGKYYHFTALKTGDLWYTTGKRLQAHGVSWQRLVDWMRDEEESMGGTCITELSYSGDTMVVR